MRRNTSVSVRTVVVFPVPPFSDSTAIVSAMARDGNARRGRDGLLRRGSPFRRALFGGQGALRSRRTHGGGIQEEDAVAADRDLVAVGQRGPLDALAVDVDAVQGAVVEHAYALGLADDERMTARDR